MSRRKARINISGRHFGEFFGLDEAQIRKIEKAYRHKLSEEMWERILDATKNFVILRPTVEGSGALNDTLMKIDKLANKAESVRHLIYPEPIDWKDFNISEIWRLHKHEVEKRCAPMEAADFFEFLLMLLKPLIALNTFARKNRTNVDFLTEISGRR